MQSLFNMYFQAIVILFSNKQTIFYNTVAVSVAIFQSKNCFKQILILVLLFGISIVIGITKTQA